MGFPQGSAIGVINPGPLTVSGGTTATDRINFGADVNLYRSAANTLKTDDALFSALSVFAFQGTVSQVALGQQGPSNEPGLTLGNAADTNLYRNAANSLATDDTMVIKGALRPLNGSLAGASDVGGSIFYGTGAPNNASGGNGDIYLRVDGGALTTIYQRRAGAWVGIV